MFEKVTEIIGKSFSELQLLLVALQCGKQIEIADLFSCVHQKAIILSQVGHNQHGMDFSQSSLFSSGPMGIDDIFWQIWNLFPFRTSMVSLLNLVRSFSSFFWNHSIFAELQICALSAETMNLHFWYMPLSKSQDKNPLHVVSWLPLRAGTSCQRSDCKSAFWRCWP